MKKVTLTFIVSDEVANEIQNDLLLGLYDNAVNYLHGNCAESDYNIEDVKEPNDEQGNGLTKNKLDEIVEICCYNKWEKMTRREGLKKYREGMLCSEGSEHERYEKIFFELIEGKMFATDC